MYATIDISEKSEGVKDSRLKKYPYYFFSFVTDVDNQRLHFSRIPLFRLDSRSVVAFVPHTSTTTHAIIIPFIITASKQATFAPGNVAAKSYLRLLFSFFFFSHAHTRAILIFLRSLIFLLQPLYESIDVRSERETLAVLRSHWSALGRRRERKF